MKNLKIKAALLVCFACFFALRSLSQSSSKDVQRDVIKDQTMFLTFDSESKTIKYHKTDNLSGMAPVSSSGAQIELKGGMANIYLNWLNPLKYQVNWTNQEVDNRDYQAVLSFTRSLASMFGSISSTPKLAENSLASLDTKSSNIKKADLENISNIQLLEASVAYSNFSAEQQSKYSILVKQMISLDRDLKNSSVTGDVNSYYEQLANEDDLEDAKSEVEDARSGIGTSEKYISSLEKKYEACAEMLESYPIDSSIAQSIFIYRLRQFIDDVSSSIVKQKSLLSNFSSCVSVMEGSFRGNPSDSYVFSNLVELSKGKNMESTIVISEITTPTHSVAANPEMKPVAKAKFIFSKFDFVKPTVSAGLFFCSTDMKGFGVSTDSTGGLIVAEDNLKKNKALTALFLNLNFDLGSQYFSPLIQLGIDPTKTRPFLLVGGGFSIPAASFAISCGPAWSFYPELQKLNVGGTVKSTVELEQDIKYQFNPVPKGMYIGVQYNF